MSTTTTWDWGDGSTDHTSGVLEASHVYGTEGDYTIKVAHGPGHGEVDVSVPVWGPNLLTAQQASIEAGPTAVGLVPGWIGQVNGRLRRVDTDAREGSSSLGVDRVSNGTGAAYLANAAGDAIWTTPVSPDKTYTFLLSLKWPSSYGVVPQMRQRIMCFDSGGTATGDISQWYTPGTPSELAPDVWHDLAMVFQPKPNTAYVQALWSTSRLEPNEMTLLDRVGLFDGVAPTTGWALPGAGP